MRHPFKRPLVGPALIIVGIIVWVLVNKTSRMDSQRSSKNRSGADDVHPAEFGQTVMNVTGLTATSVNLAWDRSVTPSPPPVGPPLPPITGYRLNSGTSSGNYNLPVQDVGDTTAATAINLTPGQTYFFAASAYNAMGATSSFSNEVSYQPALPPTPTPGPPTPTRTPSPTPGPTSPPTPSPARTPSPTPAPTPTPGGPTGITFWTDQARTIPLPITSDGGNLDFFGQPGVQTPGRLVWIQTSNNAAWSADDSMTWLNTDNPTGMGSGTSINVRPNAGLGNGTYVGDITVTAAGLPAKLIHCKLVVSSGPTPTRTPSPSPTRTPSPSPTRTPSPSPTRTPSPTPSPAPTVTPTPTPTRTPSPAPTASPNPSASPSPSAPPTPAPTSTPKVVPTPSPSPTCTPCRCGNPGGSGPK